MSNKDKGLRVSGFADRSRVNGPGLRTVLWVQGCDLGCPGCFNPGTHAADGPADAIAGWVARVLAARTPAHTGFTLSGGEPFQQAEAAATLLRAVRLAWPEASFMAYSGYSLAELRGPEAPVGADGLLAQLDLLVDGRFAVKQSAAPRPFRASENQRFWVLGRPPADWSTPATAEIQVTERGEVLLSGLPDAALRRAVKAMAGPSA